jgi:glycosyltransferase involved in cell wall biosynthesis
MKIAINTRMLLKGKMDGIGWFTFEHVSRICRNHPEHEFHLIFDRPFDQEFVFSPNVTAHILAPQARHPILFKIWYDFSIPRLLKRIGADVFVSPDMMCSLRTDVPQIVVLHDLNFEHFPKDLNRLVSWYLRKYTPKFAKIASGIVTVSEYSKMDILNCYEVKSDKVHVIHNGVSPNYFPIDGDMKSEVKERLTEGKDFFIFVSSIHPRKNLQRLIPAFDLFKQQTGSDVKLVVVGKKYWDFPELDMVYEKCSFKSDIIFTGRLDQKELNSTLASALTSVYISYYEGFGLPVVESFACEVPVIAANATSIPEVAGDAAILVDPFSVEEIARALKDIWSEPQLRNELIAKGKMQMDKFSWDTAASQFWTVIMKYAKQ